VWMDSESLAEPASCSLWHSVSGSSATMDARMLASRRPRSASGMDTERVLATGLSLAMGVAWRLIMPVAAVRVDHAGGKWCTSWVLATACGGVKRGAPGMTSGAWTLGMGALPPGLVLRQALCWVRNPTFGWTEG
jgi:hypothetical protein